MDTAIALTAAIVLGMLSLTFLGFAWLADREFKRLMRVFDEDRKNA